MSASLSHKKFSLADKNKFIKHSSNMPNAFQEKLI